MEWFGLNRRTSGLQIFQMVFSLDCNRHSIFSSTGKNGNSKQKCDTNSNDSH